MVVELEPTFTVTNPEPEYSGWEGDGSGMRDGDSSNSNSIYGSADTDGGRITADLGDVYFVDRIELQAVSAGGWGALYLNGAIVLVSRDGEKWDPVLVADGMDDPPQLTPFPVKRFARYVRLVRERNWFGVGEFRVFGEQMAEYPDQGTVPANKDGGSPSVFARFMPNVAVYWPPASNDGFGRFILGDPIEVVCRWEDKAVKFVTPQGQEAVSDAIVYVGRKVAIGGWLALGDETAVGTGVDPRSLAGAREIRQVHSSPSLAGDEVLYKAIL